MILACIIQYTLSILKNVPYKNLSYYVFLGTHTMVNPCMCHVKNLLWSYNDCMMVVLWYIEIYHGIYQKVPWYYHIFLAQIQNYYHIILVHCTFMHISFNIHLYFQETTIALLCFWDVYHGKTMFVGIYKVKTVPSLTKKYCGGIRLQYGSLKYTTVLKFM